VSRTGTPDAGQAAAAAIDDPDAAVHRLRVGTHAFAGPPQAQRRWVQMGMMQNARNLLDGGLEQVGSLAEIGALDAQQAAQLGRMSDAWRDLKAGKDDLLYETQSEPRSFLWSNAFTSEEWREFRHLARECFRSLSVGKPPLIEV
jgi:hypothetical protein